MHKNKWYKRKTVWILVIILSTAFPFIINEIFKIGNGYRTLWTAADALSYYGAFLGAAGTIVLGFVAWQQNSRMLKLEEDVFIANNTCLGFVSQMQIKNIEQKACNFDQHAEQIVSTMQNIDSYFSYSSFSIYAKMNIKENIATLINVHNVLLIAENDGKGGPILNFNNHDNKYSRVAIVPEGIEFNITALTSPVDKESFMKAIDSRYSQISMDIEFSLMTSKCVQSRIKCRSRLLPNYSSEEGFYSDFKIDDRIAPQCFWYGNSMADKSAIAIKGIAASE